MDLCSPVIWVSKDSGMFTVLLGGMTPQGEGLESRTAGGFSYSYRETSEGISEPCSEGNSCRISLF